MLDVSAFVALFLASGMLQTLFDAPMWSTPLIFVPSALYAWFRGVLPQTHLGRATIAVALLMVFEYLRVAFPAFPWRPIEGAFVIGVFTLLTVFQPNRQAAPTNPA